MQRAGTGEQARGLRVWLRVMGVVCFLTAVASVPALVPYYEGLSHVLSADDLRSALLGFLSGFFGPGAAALLALSVLSLATAAGLSRLGEARRRAAGPPGEGGSASGGDGDRTTGLREWLVGVGLLCFLPAVLVVIHTGLTRTMVEKGAYTYLLAATGVAVVTLSCLCFGFARTLWECSLLGAARRTGATGTGEAGLESTSGAASPASWSVQDRIAANWAAGMATLCVVVVPVAGYSLVATTYLYAAFSRWSLVAFALGTGFTFALVALASMSWAAVRLLWLMHEAVEAASIRPSEQRASATAVSLYVVGALCLLATLPLLRLVPEAFDETVWGDGANVLFVSIWVVVFLTSAALSFAVARSQHWIALLAAAGDRAPSPGEGGQSEAEEGKGREADTRVRLAADHGASVERPSARAAWQRRIVVAFGVMAILAAALGSSALGFRRTGPFLGGVMNASGASEDALTAWTWVARLSPKDAEAHAGRGAALASLGRYEEALAALDKAIALDPDGDYAHHNRAFVLGRLGRHEEALTAFDRAITLYSGAIALNPILAISQGPYLARAYGGKGWIYHELGRYEEALAAYDKAIAACDGSIVLDSDEAKLHYERARTLMVLDRHEEALTASDRAIELDFGNADAHHQRGWLLAEFGRHEEALAAYDRALQFCSEDPKIHSNRGLSLAALGRNQEALAAYARSIQLDPDYATAYYNRGLSLAKLGRYKEALTDFDRAIRLQPSNALAHSGRGWVLGRLDRKNDALAAYNRAIELKPDDANSYYNRACTYAVLGNKDEALRDLRRAIELDGRLGKAARKDDDLSSLRSDLRFESLTGTGEERPGK